MRGSGVRIPLAASHKTLKLKRNIYYSLTMSNNRQGLVTTWCPRQRASAGSEFNDIAADAVAP
jgi:hypothetical protein